MLRSRRATNAMFALLLVGCGAAHAPDVAPHTSAIALHWRIDVVTSTAGGADVDDAEPTIALVSEGARVAVVDAGGAAGSCSTTPREDLARVCGARPEGLVTRLVCGGDPHVDRVYCFDAMRAGERVEVVRSEYDVPSVDGPQPAPRLIERARVGTLDVPAGASLSVGKSESRDVVAK
jgi:hypothetical protein